MWTRPTRSRISTGLLVASLWLACGAAGEEVPRGRLPDWARPLHYSLDLEIVPDRERFSGSARIRVSLERATRTLWLHGRDLDVTRAALLTGDELLSARWEVADPAGVVALRLPRSVGPGTVTLEIDWSAAFGRQLRGLYRVDVAGDSYAFTQFQPIDARGAFPGFDEPAMKAPFDVTLRVREADVAVASTPPVAEEPAGDGMKRIRYRTTPPLPTYLLAWAVGPLDVVEAPPLAPRGERSNAVPFRGIAVRGRGSELAYALRNTPPLFEALEDYFGIAYPYAKLDVVAVPDFGAGAMENVGLITFRESLLLLDPERAPEWQRRAFTYVMAHELAHQWFGNLVTMTWWDDVWLNESFATWMGYRAVERVAPEQEPGMALLADVQRAMRADSLVSARSVRQPIESNHDIRNAFDAITYSKGAGVLAMFERWLGEETFRTGIRRYLLAHREGNATADDLLAALSQASGRDVATPFESFLTQPGVPFVETDLRCTPEGPVLFATQSRYLPVGSRGSRDALWQIPVCARFEASGEVGETCALLDDRIGMIRLEADACPRWVMPNGDAAGYYRWTQSAGDRDRLRRFGAARLGPRERLSVADSWSAAFRADAIPAAEVYPALGPLARDAHRSVAESPMELLELSREHLVGEPLADAFAGYARALYGPRLVTLGWDARPDEGGEERLLRRALIGFLARVVRDPEVRAEARRRGERYAGVGDGAPDRSAVAPDLASQALAVAVQEGGAVVFDALLDALPRTEDALDRRHLLEALGATRDPELAARARALALDPQLRVSEAMTPLWSQMRQPPMRAATWAWVEEHFDALVERVGGGRAGHAPWLASGFCDAEQAGRVERFFAPRIRDLEGGPRHLAGALESIRLCAALVEAQGEEARRYFATRAPSDGR